jgi:rhamnulose-1-phosphate aldolase/alcohol dehydrogenase
MNVVEKYALLPSLWDEAAVVGMSEPEKLQYRSNLLGSDKRVTNYGGGNTSAKVMQRDPLTGEGVEVLWVKGSGGDLGSMGLSGFATLYMDKLMALQGLYRGEAHEDEMVDYLPHCTFGLNPRAASIDTPLHAYVNRRHVDHIHPDALIAVAAMTNSEEATREIYGDEIGWLPWKRPGFELGLMLQRFIAENPEAKGVVLASHGLFTWADDCRDCYELTIETLNRCIRWLEARMEGKTVFGGMRHNPLPASERMAIASRIMPVIRGAASEGGTKVGHFDDSPAVMEFVCSAKLEEIAALGTSCPDHFLRTKIRPLVLGFDPETDSAEALAARVPAAVEGYRKFYSGYYDRCRRPDSPAMRDPNPVVFLIPGVGLVTFAKDKQTARVSAEFYINAINVLRGTTTLSTFVSLPEQEAFDIEYWALEEAKLQRMPKPKSLAGRVSLVTGAAGGIGSAVARKLASEGSTVLLADIDAEALERARADMVAGFGSDQIRAFAMNVTSESDVAAAFEAIAREFGGIDILVSNAGIAASAPLEETTLADWDRNMDILAKGYFLVSRAAFRMMNDQGRGGSIVFVGSKNGLAASPNAAAYCTAKAAEIHLARCLALEGAERGIRVNTVNPDAVLRGSKIWTGEWREQRAASYKLSPDDLEEHYRKRSLLKRAVLPEDIAEGVYFYASDLTAKSTGNILNVDGGNAQAFTR